MDFIFEPVQDVTDAQRAAQRGFLKLGHALILVALVIAIGVVLNYSLSSGDRAAPTPSTANAGPREVDFGFVELNPGLPTPITSYKYGGHLVVYAGEELRFQVVGAAPLPPVELQVGEGRHTLPGTDGMLMVAGPANQPLSTAMVMQGSRLSLPGGAPPRVSVKVQVHGAARPKK